MHHVPVEHEVSEELSTLAPWVDMLAVSSRRPLQLSLLSSRLSVLRYCWLLVVAVIKHAWDCAVVAPSTQLKQRLALSVSRHESAPAKLRIEHGPCLSFGISPSCPPVPEGVVAGLAKPARY